MKANRSKKPLSLKISIPPIGLISESTLNDKAAKDPRRKPTKPTVIADILLESRVSSQSHDTGASIIAIDEVNAAKNSRTKNRAPNINPPAVCEKAIGSA